jgi:hypothetical protein
MKRIWVIEWGGDGERWQADDYPVVFENQADAMEYAKIENASGSMQHRAVPYVREEPSQ